MPNASGTFDVTPGSEEAFHEVDDGPKLTHATGTQRFTGDLQADGAVDWLMCYLPDSSATFVGLQRIDGSLAGKTGTFVMRGGRESRRHGFDGDVDHRSGLGDRRLGRDHRRGIVPRGGRTHRVVRTRVSVRVSAQPRSNVLCSGIRTSIDVISVPTSSGVSSISRISVLIAAHVTRLASCAVSASTAIPWTRAVKSESRLTSTSGCHAVSRRATRTS